MSDFLKPVKVYTLAIFEPKPSVTCSWNSIAPNVSTPKSNHQFEQISPTTGIFVTLFKIPPKASTNKSSIWSSKNCDAPFNVSTA